MFKYEAEDLRKIAEKLEKAETMEDVKEIMEALEKIKMYIEWGTIDIKEKEG